jgi:hypothetical protein
VVFDIIIEDWNNDGLSEKGLEGYMPSSLIAFATEKGGGGEETKK